MSSTLIDALEALLAIALAVAVGYGVYLYKDRQYQKLEATYSKLSEEAEQAAIQHTQELQKQKDNADKDKQDALKKVATDYQSQLDSLRKRQVRPSVLPAASDVAGTCTGAQLYREDAEFLAGEAARAEQVRIERDYYYGRYEDARKMLAGEKPDGGLDGQVSNTKSVP